MQSQFFFPGAVGADVVLDQVGVERGLAVARVRDQAFPLGEQIGGGRAEAGFGSHAFAQAQDAGA
jgi:hypothetical protein